ncbi:hypothetical protein ABZ759_01095 [Streptomyces sp. NPDC047860]|uniref:hypothetical protein n=1 Tax=Streptomyces sp. NPDC047860 TaxID=3155743 RepID=UPI0033C693D8
MVPNANDSRYFLDEQSGSVAASGVRGRVQEEPAATMAPLLLRVSGTMLTLVGVGLGIGGFMPGGAPERGCGSTTMSWPHSKGGAVEQVPATSGAPAARRRRTPRQ